jgi:hypothetical protein
MNIINPNKYVRHLNAGKFEGETAATEYFYELMLEGDGETVIIGEEHEPPDSAELFQINAEESEAFNLPIGHWFLLKEDNQGFVMGSTYKSREAAERAFRTWLGE